MEKTENLIHVSDLRPRSRNVNVVVRALSRGEIREVTSRRDGSQHRVTEVTVGDESGTVLLTLWDDVIDKVVDGKVYEIKNGYTSLFRGSIRLNIGRYGGIEETEDSGFEVNESNSISNKVHEDVRWGSGYRGGLGRE